MANQTLPYRTATIVDVAKEADVSKSTVSLVLKGSPLIKAVTAERVREAAIVGLANCVAMHPMRSVLSSTI
jgi:LacI family transcriptional regulator